MLPTLAQEITGDFLARGAFGEGKELGGEGML